MEADRIPPDEVTIAALQHLVICMAKFNGLPLMLLANTVALAAGCVLVEDRDDDATSEVLH